MKKRSFTVFSIRPHYFFFVAGLLMDFMYYNSILTDTFFADATFEASQRLQGILGSVSAIGYAFGCLIFGPLSERSGRRLMTISSIAGLLICLLLLMRCRSVQQLMILMLVKRFIAAMYWPAVMAWLADVSLPQDLGRNLCVFNTGWATGNILGGWFPGHFGEWMATEPGGYNAVASYAASAVLAVALLLWLSLATPRQAGERREPPQTLSPVNTRLFLLQGWIAHLATFAAVALTVFMFPRLGAMPHLGLSHSGQSTLHSLRLIVNLLTFVGLFFTKAWHYRFYPIYGGLAVGALGLLLMGYGPNYATVLLGQLFLGLTMGVVYTASQYYSLMIPKSKGKGSAVHESMVGFAYCLGPAIGGVAGAIFESPRAPFAAGTLPLLLAIVAVVHVRQRVKSVRATLPSPAVPAD